MAKVSSPAATPRRTQEHIVASQSRNYVERFIIDAGHTIGHPVDYGTDILMNTFDEDGYAEPGDIHIQLKASGALKYSPDGSYISFTISSKHFNLWMKEPLPVFLILYGGTKKKAFWLYIQEYFQLEVTQPKSKAKSVTVRVPIANEFDAATVAYMREKKSAALMQIEGVIKHET